MTFTVGGVDVTAVHVGATAADAVYLGSDKVWPSWQGPPQWEHLSSVSGSPYPDGKMKSAHSGPASWVVLAPVDAHGLDAVTWLTANAPSTPTTLEVSAAGHGSFSSSTIMEYDNPATSGNIGIKVHGADMHTFIAGLPDGTPVTIELT